MTTDNRWDKLYIQLTYHSLVIGALKYNNPGKYNDNYEYDVVIGSISSIYTARLTKGLSDEAATVSEITTKESHSELYAKTLVQRWRIVLGPVQ